MYTTNVPSGPVIMQPGASAIEVSISAAFLEVQGTAVAVEAPLMAAGLDSVAGTEFSNKLSQELSTELSQTVLFDYPSISAVSSFIAETATDPLMFEQDIKYVMPVVAPTSVIPTEPSPESIASFS